MSSDPPELSAVVSPLASVPPVVSSPVDVDGSAVSPLVSGPVGPAVVSGSTAVVEVVCGGSVVGPAVVGSVVGTVGTVGSSVVGASPVAEPPLLLPSALSSVEPPLVCVSPVELNEQPAAASPKKTDKPRKTTMTRASATRAKISSNPAHTGRTLAGMRITLRSLPAVLTASFLWSCDQPSSTPPDSTGPSLSATQNTTPPPPTTPPPAPGPETTEERHVSKSPGAPGGVTLLWPRIIPRDIVDQNRDLAAALQARMKTIVEKHLPGRTIDYRPEPERVCPKNGCAGVSVGLLLSRKDQGCLVLALISRPGTSPTRIVPWVGKVQLRADTVGFREWPESQITVADYVPCNSLLTTMDAQEAAVGEALKAAAQ